MNQTSQTVPSAPAKAKTAILAIPRSVRQQARAPGVVGDQLTILGVDVRHPGAELSDEDHRIDARAGLSLDEQQVFRAGVRDAT